LSDKWAWQFHRFVALLQMSSKLQSQKMTDTSKDELLLDGGITTTTSRSEVENFTTRQLL